MTLRLQVRAVGLVVLLSLRRMLKSPPYLASMILLPFLAVLMVGVVIGPGARPLPVGLVGGAEGTVGPRVRGMLASDGTVRVRSYAGEPALRAAVQQGDVLAGLVLPGPSGVVVRVFADPSRPAGAAARLAIVSAVDRVGAVVQAAQFAAAQSGVPLADAQREADRLSAAQRQIQVQARFPSGTTERGQYDYGSVGMLVLFMFVTAVSSGAMLVDNRRRGLTARLLATELWPGSLMVGEALSRYVTIVLQAGVVLLGGSLIFGVRWGPIVPVAAVVALYALVGAAAGIVVGVLVRTFEQAIVFGTVGAIGLGMLGGCLWPLRLSPPALRALARLTPQHWAIDALLRLVNRSSGAPGIGAALLALGGFAFVMVAVAAGRLRRMAVS
ncbi:MAG TPA: ABC transporter permease [Acidimicrobiales bacterium]|nr:ABC transporter permease [Acidimicrobiales bacterium]